MKSNKQLEFTPMYGHEGYAYGDDRSCETADAGGTLTLTATIGKKGTTYRVYAYLWHSEQDASREGYRGQCCGRGQVPDEAMDTFRRNAIAIGWESRPIDEVLVEMREVLAS